MIRFHRNTGTVIAKFRVNPDVRKWPLLRQFYQRLSGFRFCNEGDLLRIIARGLRDERGDGDREFPETALRGVGQDAKG